MVRSAMTRSKCAAMALIALVLVGCHKAETPAASAPNAPVAEAPKAGADAAAIAAAVDNPQRLGGDRDEDAWRQPTDVLTFLEVRPGMHVVDYFSAGGYYTELLSYAVGPTGQVIAYNNAPYLKFAGEVPKIRYGVNRLPNVVQLTTPPEDAPFDPASVDAALFVMSYHDLYWRPKQEEGWPPTDPAQSLAKLVPALKPGAVVVVVDHVATAGADPFASVDAMHRIDPAVVKRDFETAGLKFDGESAALHRPGDDHTKPVFDKTIQHKTDLFIYRFKKT